MKSTRALTPTSGKFESAYTYQQKPKYKNSLATSSIVINADISMFPVFLGDRRNEHLVRGQALFSGLLGSLFPAIWPWISDHIDIIFFLVPGVLPPSVINLSCLRKIDGWRNSFGIFECPNHQTSWRIFKHGLFFH